MEKIGFKTERNPKLAELDVCLLRYETLKAPLEEAKIEAEVSALAMAVQPLRPLTLEHDSQATLAQTYKQPHQNAFSLNAPSTFATTFAA